ncbi:hypothetical protein [Pedobacter kyonggii]|uniref:Uncharacterized protein n=1 Tax=Pedobacter kyonggii TaxID=1926871 RepID=A0A4Q9H3N0_9SPHI|nr:hypothetical protein [Pedobacter kyonggii]TBO36348.1 hypothetical protein EYS08_25065 [Pedobacter kyonggii]
MYEEFTSFFHASKSITNTRASIPEMLALWTVWLMPIKNVWYNVDAEFLCTLEYVPCQPYFHSLLFFAVVAVSFHLASLHYLKTKSAKVSNRIAIIGIIVSALIIIGYTNAFKWRAIPVEYENFIKGI